MAETRREVGGASIGRLSCHMTASSRSHWSSLNDVSTLPGSKVLSLSGLQLGVRSPGSSLLPQDLEVRTPWFAFPALSFQSCCGSIKGSWSHICTPSSLLSSSVCGPRKHCQKQQSKTKRAAWEVNMNQRLHVGLLQMKLTIKPKAVRLQTDMPEVSLPRCLTKRRIKVVRAVGCCGCCRE